MVDELGLEQLVDTLIPQDEGQRYVSVEVDLNNFDNQAKLTMSIKK
jgi:hypothetical protein